MYNGYPFLFQHMKSCQIHKSVKNMTMAVEDFDTRKEPVPAISTLISMISLNSSKMIFSVAIWTNISKATLAVILHTIIKIAAEHSALMTYSPMTIPWVSEVVSWMSILVRAQANNIVKLWHNGSTIWWLLILTVHDDLEQYLVIDTVIHSVSKQKSS